MGIKNWIKKVPFFLELDYFRRKVRDLPLFDFMVEPLAQVLEEWPRSLILDTTNQCNAKCVWCPNPDLEDMGTMKMDLYRRIIDDYASVGGIVHFGTFGEPLMDKTLSEKIKYARQKSSIKKVNILTNAFFLNEKTIPVLIEHSVGVDISLDELEKDTFENVKKMSYDVTRRGILGLLEANDRASNPVPVNLRIKTLMTREAALANEFFKILSGHNCTISLTPVNDNIISNWAGKFDKVGFFEKYLPSSGGNGSKYTHKRFNSTNTSPCTQLWQWMIVYWNGEVVLCCADMFSRSTVGNLREKSIKQVWNGEVLVELRKKMIARKRFEIPLCQNCDIHLSWHNLRSYYDKRGELQQDRSFI